MRAQVVWAGAVTVVSGMLAVVMLKLWNADLRVPFEYQGDVLSYSMWVKGWIEHGSWIRNPSLGAPFGFETYDFPLCYFETAHLLVVRLIALFSHDSTLLFNVYFLLSFPLIGLTTFVALRALRIGALAASIAAILYTFIPSHLIKGEGHIFMAAYWELPLALLLMAWLVEGEPLFFPWRRRRSWLAAALCLLIATTGLYYAFFGVVLLAVIGAWGAYLHRSWRHLASTAVVAGGIVVVILVQALPVAIYHRRHGKNDEVAKRDFSHSEIFGLKVTQLLLPIDGHRIGKLAKLKERYESGAPLVNENRTASLGIVGSLGFLALLATPFVERRDRVLRMLSLANLSALLLGTIGGFGTLFSLLVSPDIRTYCRIHLFIGLFALTAIALFLDRVRPRLPQPLFWAGSIALVAVGVLDQTSPSAVRPYAQTKTEFQSDRAFVSRIEAVLPPGAAVFQLPYSIYPEAAPIEKMLDYDQMRGYLHSHQLRWSYPVMQARDGDIWDRVVKQKPPRMIELLALAGFSGVYIDRFGYADGGSEIEVALGNVLDQVPIVSANGRLSFFDLRAFAARQREGMSESEWRDKQGQVLYPWRAKWDGGFYEAEFENNYEFHWSSGRGTITLANAVAGGRKVRLRMRICGVDGKPLSIVMKVNGRRERLAIDAGGSNVERVIDFDQKPQDIELTGDLLPIHVGQDTRDLAWRLDDLQMSFEAR